VDISPQSWTIDDGGGSVPYDPAQPGELVVASASPFSSTAWRLSFGRVSAPEIAALANPVFLERTGARVGDTLEASIFGLPVTIRLLGEIDGFPSLPPTKPLLLADGPSLDLARYAGGVTLAPTSEWWLATDAGASEGVAAVAAAAPITASVVVERAGLEADLAGDPLGLGVIGILGLGSMAALVFAAIGFLLTTTVSTQERLGEFALLKALGLAPRQLFRWLTLESIALLAVGLLAGILLGIVLAWVTLPFATLTATGEPPIPAPVVVVPLDALVPTLLLAAFLVVASMLLVRRLVPAAQTSAVLRARDE
jgi:predicted lysophospholipase L1 biosynthesis ABC-type transport system permease subunit